MLPWGANPSRGVLKDETRCWGLVLQRKLGSCLKFDEIETDTGTCFRIHFVMSVSVYESLVTQIESKSKTTEILNKFCSSV